MARAPWCIWTGRIIATAPLLPLWRRARPPRLLNRHGTRATASRDVGADGADAASAMARAASRAIGRRITPSAKPASRKRSTTKRPRRRAWPRRREPPKPAETALRKASSARGPGGEAAAADAVAGRASARTRRRASWELKASRARCAPSGATASPRGTTPSATMPSATTLRGRPARTGRTAMRARAGRGPRRVSPAKREPVLSALPKAREEPAVSASVSAQPEAEPSSGPPRKGWWRR